MQLKMQDPAIPKSLANPDATMIRILVLEDKTADFFILSNKLGKATEHHVLSITRVISLANARHKLKSEKFDLIIQDLSLTDSHGGASVAALRAQAPDMAIAVYTGNRDGKARREALESGAEYYLIKDEDNISALKMILQEKVIFREKRTASGKSLSLEASL